MKEKKSFYCFARQRRVQQANALQTVPPLGEMGRCFYSLGVKNRAAHKDQGRGKLVLSFKASVQRPPELVLVVFSCQNKDIFIKYFFHLLGF